MASDSSRVINANIGNGLEWSPALMSQLTYKPLKILIKGCKRKAKVDEKAQHTGVCGHFESAFNAVSALQRDIEQVLRALQLTIVPVDN